MDENGRRSFLENLVFGLALLLFLIIAYYAVKRLIARDSKVEAPAARVDSRVAGQDVPLHDGLGGSGTRAAVGELPRVRAAYAPGKRRKTEVPSPISAQP